MPNKPEIDVSVIAVIANAQLQLSNEIKASLKKVKKISNEETELVANEFMNICIGYVNRIAEIALIEPIAEQAPPQQYHQQLTPEMEQMMQAALQQQQQPGQVQAPMRRMPRVCKPTS